MKTIVLIGILVILLGVLACAIYMGAFSSIVIEELEKGPYMLVYGEMHGTDMKKIGEITSALDTMLERRNIPRRKPLDIFFPDGRAEIGFAVEGVSSGQLSGMPERFKVRNIPPRQCMVARFPRRNIFSFVIGYLKVDPALAHYRETHGYVKGEAYSLNDGGTIVYMQPVVRRAEGQ